jgi:Nucleotidyl transferase AbiEii toxin, Type IV TA system
VTTTEPPLGDKVDALAHALGSAGAPFAFGGALALAYYAEPRATVDVDINVFLAPGEIDLVAGVLAGLGIRASDAERDVARRDGQVRLFWGTTPIDLFFAYDVFHFHAAERVRSVPFGDELIPVLAPEDLLVCKIVFNRRKDWIDIEQMLLLSAGTLDVDDVRRWIVALLGGDDDRIGRFETAVRDVLGDPDGSQ